MRFLLLLSFVVAALEGVRSQGQLVESVRVVKSPADSVTLTCKASGFPETDYMSWLQQDPGKGLESVSDSLNGRFTISRANFKNELYLQISDLQSEDVADYFCAIDTV